MVKKIVSAQLYGAKLHTLGISWIFPTSTP